MKVGLQLVISPWDAWIFKLDNFVSMQLRLCCSLHVRCQTLPSKFPWQERLRPGEVFVFTYTFTLIRMDSTCPTMILIFILPVFSWNAFPRISRTWWPTKWLPNSGRTASDGQTWSDPYLPLVVNCISQEGARVKSWVRVGLVDYVQGQPVTFIEHCMQGGGGQTLYGNQLRFLRIW